MVEKLPKRMTIEQTDAGVRMALEIKDLEALIAAFRSGAIREGEREGAGEVFDPGSALALSGEQADSPAEAEA